MHNTASGQGDQTAPPTASAPSPGMPEEHAPVPGKATEHAQTGQGSRAGRKLRSSRSRNPTEAKAKQTDAVVEKTAPQPPGRSPAAGTGTKGAARKPSRAIAAAAHAAPMPEAAESSAVKDGTTAATRTVPVTEETPRTAVPLSVTADGTAPVQPEVELPGALPDSPALREILAHGQRVATYADILFRELAPLHGLAPEWRKRLRMAACLHDLGWMEGRKGHHKTSMRIIDEDSSLPIADEDRPWVALLARYHRKAVPSRKHPRFALLKRPEQEAVRKAAALLRLADALDYTHRGVVLNCTVETGRRKVFLRAACSGDCAEEIARCKEKGDLFARLFGKEPKLVCLPQ